MLRRSWLALFLTLGFGVPLACVPIGGVKAKAAPMNQPPPRFHDRAIGWKKVLVYTKPPNPIGPEPCSRRRYRAGCTP